MIWHKIRPYISLIRGQNQIGTTLLFIPCLYGVIYSGNFSVWNVVLFFASAFFARSCGCILNDIADKNIDKNLPTTSSRPLASGVISIKQAVVFFAILLFCGLSLLFFYSKYIFFPLVCVGFLVVLYPYTKRFFAIPQFFLGIVYASGFLFGIIQSTEVSLLQIDARAFCIYIALVLWVIFYDTIYAKRDFKYDKFLQINSSTIFFEKNHNIILQFCFILPFCLFFFISFYAWFFVFALFFGALFFNKILTTNASEAKINNILYLFSTISNGILCYNQSFGSVFLIFLTMFLQIISTFFPPIKGFKMNAWCVLFLVWVF